MYIVSKASIGDVMIIVRVFCLVLRVLCSDKGSYTLRVRMCVFVMLISRRFPQIGNRAACL